MYLKGTFLLTAEELKFDSNSAQFASVFFIFYFFKQMRARTQALLEKQHKGCKVGIWGKSKKH